MRPASGRSTHEVLPRKLSTPYGAHSTEPSSLENDLSWLRRLAATKEVRAPSKPACRIVEGG
jgi:hypothetical protein